MDTFWGHSIAFWTAIAAIAASTYTVFVVITLWFIYHQVRMAAKTFQFDANCRLQQLVDDFREDRRALFQSCPLELALDEHQFLIHPPGRHKAATALESDKHKTALTPRQQAALVSTSDKLRERIRHVISRMNDIGQLVEDGFIDKRVFLGKYHVMVIQCCNMVEGIRRDEEAKHGGNYGQRLLRMRRWATNYNDSWPKHRAVPIEITSENDRRTLYRSPTPSFGLRWVWRMRRWMSRY
jgi:hypothetical protein